MPAYVCIDCNIMNVNRISEARRAFLAVLISMKKEFVLGRLEKIELSVVQWEECQSGQSSCERSVGPLFSIPAPVELLNDTRTLLPTASLGHGFCKGPWKASAPTCLPASTPTPCSRPSQPMRARNGSREGRPLDVPRPNQRAERAVNQGLWLRPVRAECCVGCPRFYPLQPAAANL